MSHRATNWAIEQRGLKPATKIVLWHLCDRHNVDKGCFPEQARLAADCEMSKSTLNVHLDKLEELGLIRREKRFDQVTKKARSTRYHFPFEDHEAESEIRTRKSQKAESGKCQKPSPENGESRVRNPDSNPVREPGREPLSGENASEDGAGAPEREDLKKWKKETEAAFWTVVKDWPGFAGMPKTKAKAAWFNLTDDERVMAASKRDAWFELLRSQKKTHTPAPSTYFNEKLFADVPDAPEAPKAPVELAPFGKSWMAYRLHLLEQPRHPWKPTAFFRQMQKEGKRHLVEESRRKGQFPDVARLDAEAVNGRGQRLPAERAQFDTDAYTQIVAGSPEWDAWQDWHTANDYPLLPKPHGEKRFVWFPSKMPPAFPVSQEEDHHAFG